MHFTLHGFLGRPSDWNFLDHQVTEITHLDLFDEKQFDPQKGLKAAGKAVNKIAKNYKGNRYLVAYSMGARIALHALIEDPTLWQKALLISAHPGLSEGREKRLENDLQWSRRFLQDPWDSLMESWNGQAVFAKSKMERLETDFSREMLSRAIVGWSLGSQEDLCKQIAKLQIPLLWITGERDKKFTLIAKSIAKKHAFSKHLVIPNAGHRVLWEDLSIQL